MARKNPPAKWVLPAVVDPENRRCLQVPVPDDPAHIAAFRGAMLSLASAYNWADDPAHTAKLVAQVWRDIIDSLTNWGCDMSVQTILRANPDGCGVDWSLDNGETWYTIDLATCITLLAGDSFNALFPDAFAGAIADAIANGTVQANGVQSGPELSPLPGECASVHVVMQARENWISPMAVQPGTTIRVSAASGGWNDGAVYWYCPDGNSYGIGECTPATAHYEATDPLTTAHHMTVVGRLLADGDWFNPMDNAWSVPAGKATQLFVLQANDQSLSDNYGEIQFDVEVCMDAGADWTYLFNFATGQHGFVSATAFNGCESLYYGGSWHNCPNAGAYYNVEISPPHWDDQSFNLRGLRMIGHQGGLRGDGGAPVGARVDNSTFINISPLNVTGDFDYSWTGSMDGVKLTYVYICTNYNVDSHIDALYVSGQGFCPYAGF